MSTPNATAGQDTGMLKQFEAIQVRNEEIISPSDLQFCESQQESLYQTLLQLSAWYDIFYKDAQKYIESHRVNFQRNGTVTFHNPFYDDFTAFKYYPQYEFTPFDAINEIVEKRRQSIEKFATILIRYFNNTHNLSVPIPEIDKDLLTIDFCPHYMTYVDAVIDHLGGRSFRQAAEEELIKKLHEAVHRYGRHDVPVLKSNLIIFNGLFHFDHLYFQYHQNKVRWGCEEYIDMLCKGLALYAQDRMNGDCGIIYGYNSGNVNTTSWYPLSTSPAEYMKFYKNGRVDVKFKDAGSAGECFQRLKLNELGAI
jgi:hypothetical protein